MERLLVRGEKVVIGKISENLNSFGIDCIYNLLPGLSFDVDPFVFMLDGEDQTEKDNIIFYNNPISSCGSIVYAEYYGDLENRKTFEVNLSKLPQNINKLTFGCSIYKKITNPSEAGDIKIKFQAKNKVLNNLVFAMLDEIDLISNEAFIFGEIYKYKDLWKFNTLKYNHSENLLDVLIKLNHMKIV